jgi:hypothetical protein
MDSFRYFLIVLNWNVDNQMIFFKTRTNLIIYNSIQLINLNAIESVIFKSLDNSI